MDESRARPPVLHLSPRVAVILGAGSRTLLGVATLVVAVADRLDRLPDDPDGGVLTPEVLSPVLDGLLLIIVVGLLASLRLSGAAFPIVSLGGGGLAVVAAFQYQAPVPPLVIIGFVAPAALLWVEWQSRRPFGRGLASGGLTLVFLGGVWIGASSAYNHFLGPTHPESVTAAEPDSPVRWVWSGAVDTEGFTVAARLRQPAADVQLVVTDEAGAERARSPMVSVPTVDEPVKLTVGGLEPATPYRYVVQIDGVPDELRSGVVTTYPEGPASFRVAVGACARTHSNGAVFDAIREVDPDLYLITGDLHYRNIAENDPDLFASAYQQVHDSAARSALFRSVPIAYVWDDHDYGPDNSDSRSPTRPAAWSSYRASVPHYELATGASGSINQAFTIGRVRFVMIDSRSHRLAADATMLGPDQLDWLLAELLAARDTHALTVIVSPTTWIGPAREGADHWGAFAAERDSIGEFLVANEITNLMMLAGDAHMVAIDDGTNSGYGGHDGFPVLQAAALDRLGSVKGGPYSHGTFPGGGQFGLFEVTDDGGDTIVVELTGLDHTGAELVGLELSYVIS